VTPIYWSTTGRLDRDPCPDRDGILLTLTESVLCGDNRFVGEWVSTAVINSIATFTRSAEDAIHYFNTAQRALLERSVSHLTARSAGREWVEQRYEHFLRERGHGLDRISLETP
jgi:hypothetical protein